MDDDTRKEQLRSVAEKLLQGKSLKEVLVNIEAGNIRIAQAYLFGHIMTAFRSEKLDAAKAEELTNKLGLSNQEKLEILHV